MHTAHVHVHVIVFHLQWPPSGQELEILLFLLLPDTEFLQGLWEGRVALLGLLVIANKMVAREDAHRTPKPPRLWCLKI